MFPRARPMYLGMALPSTELRAILYSPLPERTRWMANEIARLGMQSMVACNVTQVVAMVATSLHPQLAVIDLDTLSAGELFHLHRIREVGWAGTLIALGKVPPSLRRSMGIDRAIVPPYTEGALGQEIAAHLQDSHALTMPIPIPML